MAVIRHGEQLQQVLRTLQEVMERAIVGQLVRVNAGHLEEGEVSRHLHQVCQGHSAPYSTSWSAASQSIFN